MNTQNITLSIPKDIIRKVKIIAAGKGTSISSYLTQLLEETVAREEGYQAARRRHLTMLDQDLDLGIDGAFTWTRDELHER